MNTLNTPDSPTTTTNPTTNPTTTPSATASSAATPITHAADRLGQFADRTAARAEGAIESTRRAADDSLDAMHDSVSGLRDTLPAALGRTASQVEALAQRGMDRARATSASVRNQVARTGDRTVDYIQAEPVKSVLIAAAAGAMLVTLAGWLGSGRRDR